MRFFQILLALSAATPCVLGLSLANVTSLSADISIPTSQILSVWSSLSSVIVPTKLSSVTAATPASVQSITVTAPTVAVSTNIQTIFSSVTASAPISVINLPPTTVRIGPQNTVTETATETSLVTDVYSSTVTVQQSVAIIAPNVTNQITVTQVEHTTVAVPITQTENVYTTIFEGDTMVTPLPVPTIPLVPTMPVSVAESTTVEITTVPMSSIVSIAAAATTTTSTTTSSSISTYQVSLLVLMSSFMWTYMLI